MKVAILLGEVTGKGGMETVISHTVSLFNKFNNRSEMKVFVLGGSRDETWLKKIGNEHYYCLCAANEAKAKRYLKCVFRAPSMIKKFEPDVILGADEKSVLYAKLFSKFFKRKPKIGTWIHFSLTSITGFYRNIIKTADFHLSISEGLKQEYVSNGLADDSNIHLIYNPLNLNHLMINRPSDKLELIYVGRLIYDGQKRVNDLLNAVSKIEGDWQLTIIGDGKDRDKLFRLSKKLGIDRKIIWLGWQDHPFDCIKSASLLLLTSEYEGFGMVLVEAMSRGIPCISTDCPVGPSDIIKNNVNGWLYSVRDNQALTDLLNQIVRGEKPLPDAVKIRQSVEKYDENKFSIRLFNVLEHELTK
ncbi:glycosyltransferase [Sporolactobacillus inulinus]|uniref:Uncharacterized protein n=1 Tax=Sporolactobacillus inulinus CASD TaxID=1069536 RepID=A0A0U1QQC1_9BACL|nr:glycosyltransferase [Sporolactobacillus inulinus]KLI02995.1 hypothetical protein SINU_05130 [Sporolactobacillus inulinus CASD]GEB77517.1 lipopolysaccharide 1,6-galactosyltransferase [Sporolactobacillus inulinus]